MKGRIVDTRQGKVYYLDGKEVTEAEFWAAFPPVEEQYVDCGEPASCWPMKSIAMAVHPNQIEEASESARKKGVPTDFDKWGRPILTSREHRRQYNRAYGVHDNDGGYGD